VLSGAFVHSMGKGGELVFVSVMVSVTLRKLSLDIEFAGVFTPD
jgi:hypothetical protein